MVARKKKEYFNIICIKLGESILMTNANKFLNFAKVLMMNTFINNPKIPNTIELNICANQEDVILSNFKNRTFQKQKHNFCPCLEQPHSNHNTLLEKKPTRTNMNRIVVEMHVPDP